MSHSVGMQLFCAAVGNRVSEISSLLKDHPEIDVNWTDSTRWTALHFACRKGHVEIVKLLLAHPKIDVNLRSSNGDTPLSFGCWSGRVSVVRLLLEDPRVDVKLKDNSGRTQLQLAAYNDELEVMEWLIASGRDLGTSRTRKGNTGNTAQSSQPKKLQMDQRGKLCRCWKGSFPTQHRLVMKFVCGLEC